MRHFPVLLALLLTTTAWATIPASLNYQGYLTDRDGSPQDGTTLVTFSIYTVEVAGSPIWFDTLNIDIESGLFSVQLGRPARPFPVDLFETPLWLGIQVESDAEMIPRRALTSVGFSFKAEDADSVQGKSAADLDQSLHVDDLVNPHAVTAAQAGAADQAILDAHTGDTGNPHLTTAAQTGATDTAVFSSHAADGSAHHFRYSDSESVAAILAADGSGSGIDADKVDGLEGTAFQVAIADNSDGISENSNQISLNWSEIQTIATQLASIRTGVAIFADDVELGTLLFSANQDTFSGNGSAGIAYLSTSDYVVRAGLSGTSIEIGNYSTIGFEMADCQGQPLIETFGRVLGASQGVVFSAPGSPPQPLYYLPKNSAVIADVSVQSGLDNSECVNFSPSSPVDRYAVFPNDQAITGVPNGPLINISIKR